MLKKTLLLLGVMGVLLITACKPIETNTNHNNSTNQPVTTVKEEFTNFSGNQPAILQGNGNKDYKLTFPEGGFIMIMKTKDRYTGLSSVEFLVEGSSYGLPMYSSFSAGLDETGWYSYERVEHMYSEGESTLRVESDGPYRIEIYLLPNESLNQSLPITEHGKGSKLIGPFTANGTITTTFKTNDAKMAGFTATLKSAVTGQFESSIYLNVDLETQQQTNIIDVTKTINANGSYFIEIVANTNCEWEVTVS